MERLYSNFCDCVKFCASLLFDQRLDKRSLAKQIKLEKSNNCCKMKEWIFFLNEKYYLIYLGDLWRKCIANYKVKMLTKPMNITAM